MSIRQGLVCSIILGAALGYTSTTYASASLSFLKVFVPHKHANCVKASPSNQRQFCNSFKQVAYCHCSSSGMSKSMCSNMALLYKRMISIFNTVEQACAYQQDISQASCIDSWNCYRLGGKNSKKQLCSATGLACM